MGTYSLQQQVFAISLLANAASNQTGNVVPLETMIARAVQSFFANPQAQQHVGAWEIAWGPVVTEVRETASNAMFVAQGTDAAGKPVYVVAIAGTNPSSTYDLLFEDYDTTLVPWGTTSPGVGGPHVTQGTLDGLQYLLGMTDPTTGATLQSYLAGVAAANATLVFTGHSLGGALAPALALALFANGGSGGLETWGAVRLFPVAGPTVGDAAYSALWASVFPPTPDASGDVWNQLVWNTVDIVPLAWAQLGGLSTLYPGITQTRCLGNIQTAIQQRAASSGGTFAQPQNRPLPGAFEAWAHTPPILAPEVAYFLVEALHQHVWAYFDLLDVTEIRPLLLRAGDPLQNAAPSDVKWLAGWLVATHCG